jgi:hypothetical protein
MNFLRNLFNQNHLQTQPTQKNIEDKGIVDKVIQASNSADNEISDAWEDTVSPEHVALVKSLKDACRELNEVIKEKPESRGSDDQ